MKRKWRKEREKKGIAEHYREKNPCPCEMDISKEKKKSTRRRKKISENGQN